MLVITKKNIIDLGKPSLKIEKSVTNVTLWSDHPSPLFFYHLKWQKYAKLQNLLNLGQKWQIIGVPPYLPKNEYFFNDFKWPKHILAPFFFCCDEHLILPLTP